MYNQNVSEPLHTIGFVIVARARRFFRFRHTRVVIDCYSFTRYTHRKKKKKEKSDGTRRWRCLYNWRAPKAQLTELTCAPAPATFFFVFYSRHDTSLTATDKLLKTKMDGKWIYSLHDVNFNFFKDFSFQNFDAVNVTNRIGIVNFSFLGSKVKEWRHRRRADKVRKNYNGSLDDDTQRSYTKSRDVSCLLQ